MVNAIDNTETGEITYETDQEVQNYEPDEPTGDPTTIWDKIPAVLPAVGPLTSPQVTALSAVGVAVVLFLVI